MLVDEAGMVGTPALTRLAFLADEQHWRPALVGDHHQLQAVGRGGLFREATRSPTVTATDPRIAIELPVEGGSMCRSDLSFPRWVGLHRPATAGTLSGSAAFDEG